ncbi:MAG: transglutaminase domain-containing protein [Promethearchaeota archaeon]
MSTVPRVTMQKGITWKSILLIGLLIVGLSLVAALPLSFFFNGNMGDWFGNLPLDLIPPPDQIPEGWDDWDIPGDLGVPDLPWDDMDLPEWLDDWFDNLPADWDGDIPPGEIPWWLAAGALAYLLMGGSIPGGGGVGPNGGIGGLPGMGGSMGTGLGPFGTSNISVWVSSDQPWHYWRLRAYDFFSGYTWLTSNITNISYSTYNSPGTDYTIVYRVGYSEAGNGNLPLVTLWNAPMIRSGLFVYNESGLPAENLTWNLISDLYGSVFWNASIGTPGIYFIVYTVTLDESTTVPSIESNVYWESPLNFVADPPGSQDYIQIPDLSNYSQVVADMAALASNPAIVTNNTYETAKAVMEYFKTRWWWTPYRAQIPGRDFDPGYLIDNGCGISSDFASNYVMYLRYLNISSRLVWGSVGYQNDSYMSSLVGSPMIRLSHSHFWAEVWIPYSTTSGDGEWVQFDPSPIPPVMWQPNASNPSEMIEIDARGDDDRVETSHYTMLLDASVAYDTPQDRLTSFNLNGNVVRDGITITRTWLNEPVQYTYMDVTDNLLVGQNLGSISHSFDGNSRVGPHRFNSSFYAIQNETIVTCNGTTQILIESLNPQQIKRGPSDFFVVTSRISDSVSGKPIPDVGLEGYIIDLLLQLSDLIGPQSTNTTGEVTSVYSFPSNQPIGVYNFTNYFNGTFFVDYPEPYTDYQVTILTSASISPNETLIVITDIYINLTVSGGFGSVLPRSHNISFSGYLNFDNGTGVNGGLVTVWWENSTGTYKLFTDATDPNGLYQGNYFIPGIYNDPAWVNNVNIHANFSAAYGNCSTTPVTYGIGCANWTNITLNTDVASFPYIIRDQTNIHVWGTLSDYLGVASTDGLDIEIRVFETQEVAGILTTSAGGYFDGIITIPDSQHYGIYNLCAYFSGDWGAVNVPSSASQSPINTTHEFTVVASTVLTKTTNPTDEGRVIMPLPMIAGDDVYVSGYLLFENGTPLQLKEIKAWWIKQDGTEVNMGSDATNTFGLYNISYTIPMTEPTNVEIKVNYSAGSLMTSLIRNATTSQDPPVVWAVNISINSVTPSAAIRGLTQVTIEGLVIEKHGWLTPFETIYLTLGGQNIIDVSGTNVTAVTDENGDFSASFIINNNYPINSNYEVNATLTNSSYIFNQAQTGTLEVSCTTNIVNFTVDRTALIGENITVSGRLVDNLGQNIDGNVILFANNSYIFSEMIQNGIINWEILIPNDPLYAGMTNLTLWHNGSAVTIPSSAELWQNIPKGVDMEITSIVWQTKTYTNFTNFILHPGSPITICGRATDNESDSTIFNRNIQVYYNSSLLGEGPTDSNGEFQIDITIPSTPGDATLYINFTANEVYLSPTIDVEVVISPTIGGLLMQYLPWILGITLGVICAVVGVKVYSRRVKSKVMKVRYEGLNLDNIQRKLAALQEGKRFQETIIFAYQNYLQIMKGYYNIAKRPSQTAREFAMYVVKHAKIPPTMIYPFTNFYEQARFGPHEINSHQCGRALQLFSNLHDKIKENTKLIVPRTTNEA